MGMTTLATLARRGCRVLGVDRFAPPHTRGSSHGESRIIREAYAEGSFYVPLVRRAREVWAELERETGESLLLETGGIFWGRPESPMVAGSIATAATWGLAHEILESAELRRRFPFFTVPDGMLGLFENASGVLFPEVCLRAAERLARSSGAEFLTDVRVLGWEAGDRGVTVRTTQGEFSAGRIVLAAGAWLPELLGASPLPLEVHQQTLFWFRARNGALFDPAVCPIYIGEPDEECAFYGFPALGGAAGGVKVALHNVRNPVDPESRDPTVRPEDTARMCAVVARYLPGLEPAPLRAVTCLYTNTPDEHFVIDYLPGTRRVVVASCCSGHGFKFAAAIGEVLACLATDEVPGIDLTPFRWRE